MITRILRQFSKNRYRRYLKQASATVKQINTLEESFQKISDDELKAKTEIFKKRYTDGETLEQLLPEAYAVIKNATRRLYGRKIQFCEQEATWDMIYFDVQLIGGIALNDNKITEMGTGEGKTLVATLPLYLNALSGKNCRLATVNDYLARRDSEWMGQLYNFLGLTVGCIQSAMDNQKRREMYACDITYGTANEFGFDYLRDNSMALKTEDLVQTDHFFCIIDEVDSILIDEARTPLIISGPAPIERELPFQEMKGGIDRLTKQQTTLCNEVMSTIQPLFETDKKFSEETLAKLMQVKVGSPKNKLLLRFMQEGHIRTALEKYENEMSSDFRKEEYIQLKEELFYTIDEKGQHADLTEKGRQMIRPNDSNAFLLPDLSMDHVEIDNNADLNAEEKEEAKAKRQKEFERISEEIHTISQLLRAYAVYERDVSYMVKDGRVIIIDENTGRAQPRSRWSDGLHQAVEAKENVQIEKETRTYATITLQNYFRLYEKLAGMTGTAETEVQEFRDIYQLDVIAIPPNRPVVRKDDDDVIYRTRREKYNAVIKEIEEVQKKEQPVLVGTVSVEASEVLSRLLKRARIGHNVLNAKYHEKEAEIIARAGQKRAVTIATNMAGRGTDIKLGEGVTEAGGLYVIGTERHTSRRIDRQLRGRSGRQGDPGHSRFFISLEDDLLRLFANTGTIGKLLEKSVGDGAISLPTWVIENAQKRVEEQRYASRKQLLQYDDVLNQQRTIIYELRNDAIHREEPKTLLFEIIEEELIQQLEGIKDRKKENVNNDPYEPFLYWVNHHFPVGLEQKDLEGKKSTEALKVFILDKISIAYTNKEHVEDPEALKALEKYIVLSAIDKLWQGHLTEMDELRQSVGLRGYGQKNPLQEYKSEAFLFFEELMNNIRSEICYKLFHAFTNAIAFKQFDPTGVINTDSTMQPKTKKEKTALISSIIKTTSKKVGRNEACPCGSGKKYKQCCGR